MNRVILSLLLLALVGCADCVVSCSCRSGGGFSYGRAPLFSDDAGLCRAFADGLAERCRDYCWAHRKPEGE